MRIITITYNDQGISWGPAIHFLELWNSVCLAHPEIEVVGIAPSWTAYPPIFPTRFNLRLLRVPNIPLVRQIIYDLRVAAHLLIRVNSKEIIYVRLSQFHLFSTLVLWFKRNLVFLELNGLLVDDAISGKRGLLFTSFVRWQERVLVCRAEGIISVSHGIANAIRETYSPSGELVTFKNGVGIQFFDDQPSQQVTSTGRTRILYVGTFTPWDGAARLLDLARAFPAVEFQLVGDGPAREALEATAPSNVLFVGRVPYDDLPRYYRQVDAGVVLYEAKRHQRVELSSLKTLEYLASGLPVFTTNVPGQEFIAELGVGFLTTEEHMFEDFGKFLDELPELRMRALNVRPEIRCHYSWNYVAEQTVELILTIMKGRRVESSDSTIENQID
jgi:glycosyltransferase involved in cell wall biosynthesis